MIRPAAIFLTLLLTLLAVILPAECKSLANGNRETRVTSAGTDNYTWDDDNRLTDVEAPAGGYGYAYDHRGRRVVRDESAAGGDLTELSFSGGSSVQEADSTGTVGVELIRGSDWGGGVGGVLYTIRDDGTNPVQRSYNAYNSRGDVVSTSDQSGAATWQAAYEAFGTRTDQGGSNPGRQRANTKDEDPTGLLNEGHRYRDLEAGVFISRDPAGFVDGPNVYAYVAQNPWSAFDPEGLDDRSLGDWLHHSFGPAGDGVQGLAAWEDRYQVSTRTAGGAQVIGGALESAFGAAATPATAGVGAVAFVHGVDNMNAGIAKVFTGQHHHTATHQGLSQAASALGAEPQVAHNFASGTEAAISIGGPAAIAGSQMKNAGTLGPAAFGGPPSTARAVVTESNAAAARTTVYRVEGMPNTRVTIGEGGQVAVQGDQMLFLNFGDKARAEAFLAQRLGQGMSGAQMKSFEVPSSFLDDLRATAVPESMAKQFPGRPLVVDPTKAADQFGLKPDQIRSLQDAIIQGSGKTR